MPPKRKIARKVSGKLTQLAVKRPLASYFSFIYCISTGSKKASKDSTATGKVTPPPREEDQDRTAPPAKRVRKTGQERAYPQSILNALKEGTPLFANRRGIVPLSSESEKPMITADELYKNRRLGMSFKSIGKKLGIECAREEVVRIYDILRENSPGTLPDIQSIPISAKRQLPSPM